MSLEFVYQDFNPVIEIKRTIPEQEITEKNSKLPVCNLLPEITKQLQEKRVKNRWTIEDLANKVGTKSENIIAYETGKQFPNADMLKKLQSILNTRLVPD